jgi:hypothetical protein
MPRQNAASWEVTVIGHRLERRLASVFGLMALSSSPFLAAGPETRDLARVRAIELRADVAAGQWRAAGR